MTGTRIDEKALEIAARAICAAQGLRWEDQFSVYSSNGDPAAHSAFVHDAEAAITAYLTAREEAGFVEVNVKGIDLAEMRERARKEPVPTILLLSQAKVYEDRAVLLAMLAAKPAD
jgi:hypothetical protein